jgi:hypothetical protein
MRKGFEDAEGAAACASAFSLNHGALPPWIHACAGMMVIQMFLRV